MKDTQNSDSAVSVYGQNDQQLEDFPILKAFQQYIDAEHAKARKRMATVCAGFVIVIVALIAAFMYRLVTISANHELANEKLDKRNQELNDKLLEYAMTDRNREPVESPKTDAALKEMTEALLAIQKQIAAQEQKIEKAEKDRENAGPTAAQKAMERQLQADTEKLIKDRALLASEKEKLEVEREKLRKQEVEIQRRRLYPEYYKQQEAPVADAVQQEVVVLPEKPTTRPPSSPVKPKVGKDGSVNYFDAYDEDVVDSTPVVQPKKKTISKPVVNPVKKAAKINENAALEDVEPVEYFKVSDGDDEEDNWLIPAK